MTPVDSDKYAIGVDYGTESGRAVVVRLSDGEILGSSSQAYPHGVMDERLSHSNVRLPFDTALHDADDYVVMLPQIIGGALAESAISPRDVVAIGIDTTASTPMPSRADGTPLSRLPEHRDNLHAYAKLWKHHAAEPQARHLNAVWSSLAPELSAIYGGSISSEWLIPKALQIHQEDPAFFTGIERFVEIGDWVVWQLTGTEVRNKGAAGYKACYQEDLGGYPSAELLDALADDFSSLLPKLQADMAAPGEEAGTLSPHWQEQLGLPAITVGVGNMDAHAAVVAAGINRPGQMLLVMGTSVCDMLVSEEHQLVPGISGVVDDGMLPGSWGYEAGQAGVGDSLNSFVRNLASADVHSEAGERGVDPHQILIERVGDPAQAGPDLVALEWFNGNRSVLVDPQLSGLVLGLTLDTRSHHIYRALMEASCFGQRVIIENFRDNNVAVDELVACGGLAVKNPELMQMLADVTGLRVAVTASDNLSAVGAALHAAVAAGHFADHQAAARSCTARTATTYEPGPGKGRLDRLWETYRHLHDTFGVQQPDIMHSLRHHSSSDTTPSGTTSPNPGTNQPS